MKNSKKSLFKFTAPFAIVLLVTNPVWANPWSDEPGYLAKVKAKFKFGMKNTFLGWWDTVEQPQQACEEKRCVVAATGKGLTESVFVMGEGALNLLTCLIPQIYIPVENGGVLKSS